MAEVILQICPRSYLIGAALSKLNSRLQVEEVAALVIQLRQRGIFALPAMLLSAILFND